MPRRAGRAQALARGGSVGAGSVYVTGDEDYVLVVGAADVDACQALMQRLLAENPNVRRYRTQVVPGTVKRGLAAPLEGG